MVVGGYFDAEFANDTVLFFESVKRGEMVIIVSDLLEKELVKAPAHVRVLLDTIPSDYVEHVFAIDIRSPKVMMKYENNS